MSGGRGKCHSPSLCQAEGRGEDDAGGTVTGSFSGGLSGGGGSNHCSGRVTLGGGMWAPVEQPSSRFPLRVQAAAEETLGEYP